MNHRCNHSEGPFCTGELCPAVPPQCFAVLPVIADITSRCYLSLRTLNRLSPSAALPSLPEREKHRAGAACASAGVPAIVLRLVLLGRAEEQNALTTRAG